LNHTTIKPLHDELRREVHRGAALDGVECNGSVVNSAASALRTVRAFDTIENNFDMGTTPL
jgi:hypothetical protein